MMEFSKDRYLCGTDAVKGDVVYATDWKEDFAQTSLSGTVRFVQNAWQMHVERQQDNHSDSQLLQEDDQIFGKYCWCAE